MRSLTLLIKPAGPDCNLACRYCFYTAKNSLFGPGPHRMSDELLEKLVHDTMKLGWAENLFIWQGGEPGLMGLDFFRRVVAFQQKHGAAGQLVGNAFQTNATLLDDEWCRFFAEYKFLVGISLDGPQHIHDAYRRDHAGRGTFSQVINAIETCRANKVEFNILALLHDKNVTAPDELFDFFTANQFRYWQFIPCVELDPDAAKVTDFSVTARQYGDFLSRLFDRWLEFGPGKISIRLFDSVMSYQITGRHTNCTFNKHCDDYVVVEHNGDVFCCDFFVDNPWKLGNIKETPIGELFNHPVKQRFAQEKKNVSSKCLVCRYYPACFGGCLKDRLILGDMQQLSYFCPSYKQFFAHALDRLLSLPG